MFPLRIRTYKSPAEGTESDDREYKRGWFSINHSILQGRNIRTVYCDGNKLKVHKHEIFFFNFFAETETLWSQGPVIRAF